MKLKNALINIGLAGLLGGGLAIALHDYPLYQELKQTQCATSQALYINRAQQQLVMEEALRSGQVDSQELFRYENRLAPLIDKEYCLKNRSWAIRYLPDNWLREITFFGEFIDGVTE